MRGQINALTDKVLPTFPEVRWGGASPFIACDVVSADASEIVLTSRTEEIILSHALARLKADWPDCKLTSGDFSTVVSCASKETATGQEVNFHRSTNRSNSLCGNECHGVATICHLHVLFWFAFFRFLFLIAMRFAQTVT